MIIRKIIPLAFLIFFPAFISCGCAQGEREEAQALYEQGSALYYESGKVNEAIEFFEQALELDAQHEGALEELGACYNDAGLYDRAAGISLQGIRAYPDNPRMFFNLGVAQTMQGDLLDALASYESATALFPDYVMALANYGALHYEIGNDFESRQAFFRAKGVIEQMSPEERAEYEMLAGQIDTYLKKLQDNTEISRSK